MNSEAIEIRALIDAFLNERLQLKIEPLENAAARETTGGNKAELEEKMHALQMQFERESWLESAANRVGQLQLVHFAAKFTNPASKSSSRYLPPSRRTANSSLVSTATIAIPLEPDVVGNAAALDTFKFLSLRHKDKSLLEMVLAEDAAMLVAMSDNIERSKAWQVSFAGIVEGKAPLESHQYAKQVYFPLGNSEYHLLSPLFPTSLVHAQYKAINDSRFSEESKAARKASRERKWHSHGYSEYKNLTIQNFGGTKPQNISQLNSQRRGEALLLASCPPTWNQDQVRPPLGVTSIFKTRLYRSVTLRETTKNLREFLSSTDYNNVHIRRARARLVESVCDEVLLFASGIQGLASGWSRDPNCRLDDVEALWLDPGRADDDPDFADRRHDGDFRVEVASRFARWLNAALRTDTLVLGDAEYKEWQSLLLQEFRRLPLEVF